MKKLGKMMLAVTTFCCLVLPAKYVWAEWMVRIPDIPSYYITLQGAINAAQSPATIQVRDALLNENITINNPFQYILQGGFNTDFTNNTGYTKLQGTMKIRKGTLIVNRLIIGGNLSSPENIDNDGDGYTESQGDCDDNNPQVWQYEISLGGGSNTITGFLGQSISERIHVIGPIGTTYTYELISGPQGLTVDANGVLAYTIPANSTAGNSISFQVKAIPTTGGCLSTLDANITVLTTNPVTTGNINNTGGIITDPQGLVVIEVPPGAVSTSTDITIVTGVDAQGNRVISLNSSADTDWVNVSILQGTGEVSTMSELSTKSMSAPLAASQEEYTWQFYEEGIPSANPKAFFLNSDERVPNNFKIQIKKGLFNYFKEDEAYRLVSSEPAGSNISGREAILFIHGFSGDKLGGGEPTWGVFRERLIKDLEADLGADKYVWFEFKWRTNARFQDVAADLKFTIAKIAEATGKNVHLVAHSFGGLLARTYLQGLAGEGEPLKEHVYSTPVATLTTIGTPHSGIADSEKDLQKVKFPPDGVKFPVGQDDAAIRASTIEIGGQVSMYQAGEDTRVALDNDLLRSFDGTRYLEEEEGELVASLTKYNFLKSDIPIQVLIGLRYIFVNDGLNICKTSHGDGLISYNGQRFGYSSYNGDPHDGQDFLNVKVNEYVLGLLRPDQTIYPWNTSNTYRHTLTAWLFADHREVHVKDDESHEGYVKVKQWIQDHPAGLYDNTITSLLPQTGQTKCYDIGGTEISCAGTGQDGELRPGVAWPVPRFTVTGECVIDNLTGLMWTKDANLRGSTDLGLSWQKALDFANGLDLCGYSDWRLPNRKELLSLVDRSRSGPALPDGHPFINIVTSFLGYYWSSSTHGYYAFEAWEVGIGLEGIARSDGKGDSSHAWPVRGGNADASAIDLPKTGQTTSYALGDDGEFERGVAWPVPRFEDHDNGVVTDNLTGLDWVKNANLLASRDPSFDTNTNQGYVTWQQALDYVKKLNSERYAGHSDWRLPTVTELESLVSLSSNRPPLPIGHPFINVKQFYYWSSSTASIGGSGGSGSAFVVDMYFGDVDYKSKTNYMVGGDFYFAWPVRSGKSTPLSTYTMSGTIHSGNTTGPVLSGATVFIADKSVVTGSDGTFTITGIPAGTYTFSVSKDGYTIYSESAYAIASDLSGLAFWLAESVINNLQPPSTGQTNCWDESGNIISCAGTGQDGELQNGIPWPETRFTVQGDCITDNLTGLMWPRNANMHWGVWSEALDFANNLTLCGHSDWRLPNVNELLSLVNINQGDNSYTWLNEQGFLEASWGSYCSSTSNSQDSYYAWGIDLAGWMFMYMSKTEDFCAALPVRIGQQSGTSLLLKTGQTTSYASGDDGDLEMGRSLPIPRFTSHGNGEVTDNLTGLIWAEKANLMADRDSEFDNQGIAGNGNVTWQKALDYVKKLNAESYLGHTDWRLPNLNELRSLIDYARINPAFPAAHPFDMVGLSAYEYWSSNTFDSYPDSAWILNVGSGEMLGIGKDNIYEVGLWPVRGGL